MGSNHSRRTEAKQGRPCPICAAIRGCNVGSDGLIFCRGNKGQVPGFLCLGRAAKDPQWMLYRSTDDPHLYRNSRSQAPAPRLHRQPISTEPTPSAVDWPTVQEALVSGLADHWKKELATALGVPLHALDQLPGLGFKEKDRRGPCWTFPEVDGLGNVVGVQRRYADGRKQMMQGSRRGLTVPVEWDNYSEAVYVVEGASDVLALIGMGLSAVGRPFNSGGLDELAVLLDQLGAWDREHHCRVDQPIDITSSDDSSPAVRSLVSPADRPIIVLGENDRKADGSWPGYAALFYGESLGVKLSRPVRCAFPPDDAKDVRAWLAMQTPEGNGPAVRSDLGTSFAARLELIEPAPQEETADSSGLKTACCDGTDDEAVSWLVQGYLPQGKLCLLAGEGGGGKSLITLDIAACVSRGRACLGLSYDPPAARDVLLANCEDDLRDTIRPRLRAAGANLQRVHLIKGTLGTDGKQVPFNLCHLPEIEAHLKRYPSIGLLTVDPAGAFTGGSGFDDHRDSEVRKVLGPLSDLAGRYGVCVLLVMHFSKGTTAKAVNKVMGSAGYTNAARAAFSVQASQENPGQRVLGVLKFNVGPCPNGRAFKVRPLDQAEQDQATAPLRQTHSEDQRRQLGAQMCKLQWLGDTDESPDAINAAESAPVLPQKASTQEAARWLANFLADGPRPTTECVEEGNAAVGLDRGSRWWREEVLNKCLQGYSRKVDFHGIWWFALSGQTLPN